MSLRCSKHTALPMIIFFNLDFHVELNAKRFLYYLIAAIIFAPSSVLIIDFLIKYFSFLVCRILQISLRLLELQLSSVQSLSIFQQSWDIPNMPPFVLESRFIPVFKENKFRLQQRKDCLLLFYSKTKLLRYSS